MPPVPINFPQLTFLVLDDDSVVAEVITAMLQNQNAKKVFKCVSPNTAMNILDDSNVKIDCIISDHGMEPITGLELLKRIRDGRNAGMVRDTRFVMLTGHGEVDIVRTAALLDVDGYVMKPVSQKSLMVTLTRAFARKRIIKPASQYSAVALPET